MPPAPHLGQYACEVAERSTGTAKAWLEPLSMTITVRLNAAAEVRASFDGAHPASRELDVYRRVLRVYRRASDSHPSNARACVFAGHLHDVEDVWSADGGETVEVVARDAFEAFIRRYQPWVSSYATAGAPASLNGAVAQLVGDANISAEDPGGLDVSYLHGIAGVTAIGAGWPNGYWVWEKHEPMAQAFRRMQEPEDGVGFYFRVMPAGAGGTSLGSLWIALTAAGLAAPAAGAIRPRLEYGPGTLQNVAGGRAQRVAPVNSVIAVGDSALAYKSDHETSGADYGLWPALASFPGETTTARLDVLSRGVWQPYPLDSIRLELPAPDPDAGGPWTPMLWDDLDVGQGVPVLLRGARRTVSGTATLREATVTVPAERSEYLSSVVLDLAGVS